VIVADTHVLLWWLSAPGKLSLRARDAIDRADRVGIATVSCFEVATLVVHGRVRLDRDVSTWIRQALAHERAAEIPLDAAIAVRAALIEGALRDPIDRIIYASALELDAPLVTRDRTLHAFDRRRTVW
jgi:PIN domain nuclease of toxin-antitoxin system